MTEDTQHTDQHSPASRYNNTTNETSNVHEQHDSVYPADTPSTPDAPDAPNVAGRNAAEPSLVTSTSPFDSANAPHHAPHVASGGTSPHKHGKPTLTRTDTHDLIFSDRGDGSTPPLTTDWRTVRTQHQRKRTNISPSSSPQELQLWFQQGGWKYAAAAAMLLLVVVVVVLSLNRYATEETAIHHDSTTGNPIMAVPTTHMPTNNADNTNANTSNGTDPHAMQPTPTSFIAPPPVLEQYVVVRTNGAGLHMRAQPTASGAEIMLIPEGTIVVKIGDDVAQSDFVWRNVRTPDGHEGWVAIEWLDPAP